MPSVLVVDDTAVDRRLAGGLLEKNSVLDVRYAENGREALQEIDRELPDLILTDLQMPEVDGLELVTSVNQKYPEIPVVLMTAHGSEVIAAQALANGAASYVAKDDLAESLVETVMHILAMAESDSRYRKLIECSTKTEFEFMLENDPHLINPLVDLVQQIVTSMGLFDSTVRVRLGVALEQAAYNAMVRGNLEIQRDENGFSDRHLIRQRFDQPPFDARRVKVNVLVNREMIKFVVADEGPGFDTATVPKSGDPQALKDGIGRGLVLITTFMDDVVFDNGGRTLTMVKYIK
jgi:CheY-like chemotaxis protein